MSVWEALLLGALQGATEFLPVSSSGHLVIAQEMLDVSVPGIVFEIVVHVATLVSVVVFFRVRLWSLLKGTLTGDRASWEYVGLLSIATLPLVLVGFLALPFVEPLFDHPPVPGFGLLFTGILLSSLRYAGGRGASTYAASSEGGAGTAGGESEGSVGGRDRPTVGAALAMGVAQCVALVPGVSRSGSTVVTGIWAGVRTDEAATFSFLMGIPAILGGAILKAGAVSQGMSGGQAAALGTGFVAAVVVGIMAIWVFVRLLRSGSFHRFGLYCWVVGGAYLVYLGL